MHSPCNRNGLRTYLILVGLAAGHATPASIAAGSGLLLAAIPLHLWSKGCLRQQVEVSTAGPYRFVRHPFYLAHALLDAGLALMGGWWPIMVLLPPWWAAVYVPTMRREEDAMTAAFGPAYAAYRRRVPMLVPHRRPLPRRAGAFRWDSPNLTRVEIPRALRCLTYPLLFALAARLRTAGLEPILHPGIGDALAVSLLVALPLAGLQLRRHFRKQRRMLPAWLHRSDVRIGLLATLICVAGVLARFDIDPEWEEWAPGFLLLVASLALCRDGRSRRAVAEALLGAGFCVLFEVPWLGVLAPLLVLAATLDARLARARPGATPTGLRDDVRWFVSGRLLEAVVCAGVCLWLAEEFWA